MCTWRETRNEHNLDAIHVHILALQRLTPNFDHPSLPQTSIIPNCRQHGRRWSSDR